MGIRPVKHIVYTLTGFYRRAQDFPHVLMMDDCDVAIFPSDSDHVPSLLSNNAAISGITMPVSACALLEVLNSAGVMTSPLMPSNSFGEFLISTMHSALRCADLSSLFLCYCSLRACAARSRSVCCMP